LTENEFRKKFGACSGQRNRSRLKLEPTFLNEARPGFLIKKTFLSSRGSLTALLEDVDQLHDHIIAVIYRVQSSTRNFWNPAAPWNKERNGLSFGPSLGRNRAIRGGTRTLTETCKKRELVLIAG